MARLPVKPSAAAKKKKLLKPLKLLWNITLRTCLVISRIFPLFLCLHRHPWCRLWRNRSLSSLVIGKIKVFLHQRVNFTACLYDMLYFFKSWVHKLNDIVCYSSEFWFSLKFYCIISAPLCIKVKHCVTCNLNTFLENAFHVEKWLRDDSNYICEGREWLSV